MMRAVPASAPTGMIVMPGKSSMARSVGEPARNMLRPNASTILSPGRIPQRHIMRLFTSRNMGRPLRTIG